MMSGVPQRNQAPIPAEVEDLVVLGISRPKVAMLVGLARFGGAATVSALVDETGLIRPTVFRMMRSLEGAGYVSGSIPPDERRGGVEVTWTLQTPKLARDLQALISTVQPTP